VPVLRFNAIRGLNPQLFFATGVRIASAHATPGYG
jgi:hypothetical protein